MMKMIFGVLLIVNFIGCGTTRVVHIEPKPFKFQKTKEPKPRKIRVHKDDKDLYEAYIDKHRSIIKFHNDQIDDYLNTFKEKNR